MKIGRNDPCPCGSDKKYKKCCLSKEQVPAAREESEEDDLFRSKEVMEYAGEDGAEYTDKDAGLKFYDAFLKLFFWDHETRLKKKPHIKEYKAVRRLLQEIYDSMGQYYESGKFEHKFELDFPVGREKPFDSKTLKLLEAGFDMNSDLEAKAFYDLIIYKNSPNANCITEEYISSKRFRKPEKIELFRCMLNSRLGLYEITRQDKNEGYVYVKEVFSGNEYKITDIKLSGSPDYDSSYIYMRIITYRDIAFNASLNFIFNKEDSFIDNFISENKKDYAPEGEFARFIELYNYYKSKPRERNHR